MIVAMSLDTASSLGHALGLGHQLYAGFDKGKVRLLGAVFGVPLALTLIVATRVLAHPDVGWSLARVEVWWWVTRKDTKSSDGRAAVTALGLICSLPPLLGLVLGASSWIVLGDDWGLAGMVLLPSLVVGGWATARARHLRWHLTPPVRLAGGGTLAMVLGGEMVMALAPLTDIVVRATVLLSLTMAPLSVTAQLLANGQLLTLSAVVSALGGADVARGLDVRPMPNPVRAAPLLAVCALVYSCLMAMLVLAGNLSASSHLEASSVAALAVAVTLFDSLALSYLHNRALDSPSSFALLCGLQRLCLVWPGPLHLLAGVTLIFTAHGLVQVHRLVLAAFPTPTPLQTLLQGPSAAAAAAAKRVAEAAAREGEVEADGTVMGDGGSRHLCCCPRPACMCLPPCLAATPAPPAEAAPASLSLLTRCTRVMGALCRRAECQLALLLILLAALLLPLQSLPAELPPITLLDASLSQTAVYTPTLSNPHPHGTPTHVTHTHILVHRIRPTASRLSPLASRP